MPVRFKGTGSWARIKATVTPVPLLYNEQAIVNAYLGQSSLPIDYLKLTGATPLNNLGASSAVWSSSGGLGRAPAYRFDRAVLSPADLLRSAHNEGASGSYAAWVYIDPLGTPTAGSTIHAQGSSASAFNLRHHEWRIDTTGVMSFRRFTAASTGSNDLDTVTVPTGRWVHLGVTYTTGSLIFYTDGVPSATITTTTTAMGVVSRASYIGLTEGSPTSVFKGALAHVATWTAVLTPTEMAALAAAGV